MLSEYLSLPVVPTTATRGRGLDELQSALETARPPPLRQQYPAEIEAALAQISARLAQSGVRDMPIAPRALGLGWLSSDPVTESWLTERLAGGDFQDLAAQRVNLQLSFLKPLAMAIQETRLAYVERVIKATVVNSGRGWRGSGAAVSRLPTHPVWGVLILAAVLYGLYWFVGIFGASILVGLLEENLFGQVINPWVVGWVEQLVAPMANQTAIVHGLRFPRCNMAGAACSGNVCMGGNTSQQLSMNCIQSTRAAHLSATCESQSHVRKCCDQCSDKASS